MSKGPKLKNRVELKFLFFRWNLAKTISLLLFLSLLVIFLSFISPGTLVNFAFFLLISIILGRTIFKSSILRISSLFITYSFLAVLIYLLQYMTLPEYQGLSGPQGIGTDDYQFFYEAIHGVGVYVGSSLVLTGLPPHTFSTILSNVIKIIPTSNIHLLDLILFNVMAVTFIPELTSKTAYLLTNDISIRNLSFKLSLFCPFYLTNGLILIRDGWTAMLLIASIYFFLKKKYILLALATTLCFYIRIASGVQLVIALAFLASYQFYINRTDPIKKVIVALYSIAGFSLIVLYYFPLLYSYAVAKGITENIIFREAFVEGFIAKSEELTGRAATIYTVYHQPFYIRIPFGILFFLCLPFLSVDSLMREGIFIPRNFIMQLFPILFLFYFKWLIQAILYSWKKLDSRIILIAMIFVFLLLLISQISIQPRHKTMLMPIFYILVSYGFYRKTHFGSSLGLISSILLAFIEILHQWHQ